MNELTINPNRIALDEAYLSMAEIWALRSKANRLQVGALLVLGNQIISDGYNGMPSLDPNDVCEEYTETGEIRTKREVLHAESNAIAKLAKYGKGNAVGATLYCTHSPCFDCAKLIKQVGIERVVFRHQYRDPGGIDFLLKRGVRVEQRVNVPASEETPTAPVQTLAPSPKPAPVTNPAFAQLRPPAKPEPVQVPAPAVPTPPFQVQSGLSSLPGEEDVQALIAQAEAMMASDRQQNLGAAQQKAREAGLGDLPLSDNGGGYRSSFL